MEHSTAALDKIIKKTIQSLEKGKSQIFDIAEGARAELENLKQEVEKVKEETANIIVVVDDLERKERRARLRLMEVSRNLSLYTETDIQAAYEDAKNVQIELQVNREREFNLRKRRDELELRLRALKETVQKAEALVAHVGVALGYMVQEMTNVATQVENMQHRQMLGAKIIKAQEEERRRVAREIHDGPAQAMANIVFRAEVSEKLIDVNVEQAKQELRQLKDLVRQTLKEVRKIIFDLRPMTLDDLGLVPTVRRLMEGLRERKPVMPELAIIGQEVRLLPALEVTMFRVIQEALTNVEKHSEAKNVWVRIEFRPKSIVAMVQDNGHGFSTKYVGQGNSFGILGMRERVSLMNGKIEVEAEIGKGTKVFIQLPIEDV